MIQTIYQSQIKPPATKINISFTSPLKVDENTDEVKINFIKIIANEDDIRHSKIDLDYKISNIYKFENNSKNVFVNDIEVTTPNEVCFLFIVITYNDKLLALEKLRVGKQNREFLFFSPYEDELEYTILDLKGNVIDNNTLSSDDIFIKNNDYDFLNLNVFNIPISDIRERILIHITQRKLSKIFKVDYPILDYKNNPLKYKNEIN